MARGSVLLSAFCHMMVIKGLIEICTCNRKPRDATDESTNVLDDIRDTRPENEHNTQYNLV